jgi:hypothetical protein
MSDSALQQPVSPQDSGETATPDVTARPAAGSSSHPDAASRPAPGGRGRGRAILMLTAIALLPAAVAGQMLGGWDRLPPAAQWAIIGIGLACTVAVVYLILTAESEEGP